MGVNAMVSLFEHPHVHEESRRAVVELLARRAIVPRISAVYPFEHVPDAEKREVALHAATLDAVHLRGRDRERVCDLLRGRVGADVLAQPAERDPHRNWRKKRRSFSQKGRMPAMPLQ